MGVKRPFSEADWKATPEPVRRYVEHLEGLVVELLGEVEGLKRRVEGLESRLDRNSQNSSKPPSSDPVFSRPRGEKKSKKPKGARKGHKGKRQELLEPDEVVALKPVLCNGCGHQLETGRVKRFYTHQVIELPEVKPRVTHYVLHKIRCLECRKTVKAALPREVRTGYGPRLCALIGEMSGVHGASRESVQEFLASVFGIRISTGAVQKVVDRVSEAIRPVYDRIGEAAREADVNHVDETSWFLAGKLHWLWTLVNLTTAYFTIHAHRSKEAFLELIQDWAGILVSDNYGVYRNWTQLRQACLAHYIRRAKGLSERKDEAVRRFGERTLKELRLLCRWAKAPPSRGEWNAFYARFIHLVFSHEDRKDDAGVFARLLIKEMDSLWVFLEENAVEPTNNRAERALRFGVLWRKRSNGTQSEKGNRWVERILTLKQTCRIRSLPTFPKLVHAVDSYFKEQLPDLSWIGQGR